MSDNGEVYIPPLNHDLLRASEVTWEERMAIQQAYSHPDPAPEERPRRKFNPIVNGKWGTGHNLAALQLGPVSAKHLFDLDGDKTTTLCGLRIPTDPSNLYWGSTRWQVYYPTRNQCDRCARESRALETK